MNIYEKQALFELEIWKKAMLKEPSFTDVLSKKIQTRLNNVIPDKVHQAITLQFKKWYRQYCLDQYILRQNL